ncbi:hypothetical protein HO133_009789 [Letharia lupina]|uniref:Tetratricopeptide repeat protein 15 n=1 Tax=Letharia lupina TaxID=560253 RepID=A0A8H6FEQ5_9LECA|nr:uncharacterized protein HO133_009789 [Letharia lupina]KAF6225787.1 hypothetical protein HO133_009789 [Letharia lupina]
MTSPQRLEGSSTSKRHSRNASYNRAPLARRMTKGPLDSDDPLAVQSPQTPSHVTIEAANIPIPTTSFSPERPFAQPAVTAPPPPPSKDFTYLLRPDIYHPLSQLDLPSQFRTPKRQPPPSTPTPTLLANHNFRSAATAAALRLCTPPAPPPNELFPLLYTRLACLTLISHLPFAAEESKALQDINSPFYRDEVTGKNILPWELRVLAVRLQGVGYGDGRRGVGGYYDLAREARAEVKKAVDPEETRKWQERLKELGLCVANALTEMGDAAAAVRHLESLRPKTGKDEVLEGRLALLYIHVGNVDAARQCLSDTSASDLRPLLSMADGRYADAVEEWNALPSSDLATQNLAVCLFYTGEVDKTLELLDQLVEKGRSFHALTFNLATVYELCSEKGSQKKEELVERVSKRIGETGGGERGVVDFKL